MPEQNPGSWQGLLAAQLATTGDLGFAYCYWCGSFCMCVSGSAQLGTQSMCENCHAVRFPQCSQCRNFMDRYGAAGIRTALDGALFCTPCSIDWDRCRHCTRHYQGGDPDVISQYPAGISDAVRERYCPRCADRLTIECVSCEARILNNESRQVRGEGRRTVPVCSPCYAAVDWTRCTWCRYPFAVGEGCYPDGFPAADSDAHAHAGNVCASCAGSHARRCMSCGQFDTENDMTWVTGRRSFVCPNCVGELGQCDCGEYYDPENEDPCCDSSDDDDYSDSSCSCDLCRDNSGRRLINYYSYKPDPVFFGAGPVFLGMELEISSTRRDQVASVAAKAFGALAYMKEDSSIGGGGGFELVTHPFGYDWGMENIPWASFADMEAHGGQAHSTCGMHVHVSRAGFSGACHEYRWLKFWHRNAAPMQVLARRTSDDWAAFTTSSRKAAKAIATKKGSDARYVAINPQNDHTYEVRVFASTLNIGEVKASLGLVDATVEYTHTLRSKDVIKAEGWNFEAFRTWLNGRDKYAPLIADINAKMPVTKEGN